MKKQFLYPFALTTLALALNGCGGEGGNIYAEPSTGQGVTESTSCAVTSEDCLEFILDYPIAGLNFECSSDKENHFITAQDSNAVTGACKLGDTVTFSIKGQEADKQIKLGSVDLKTLTAFKIADAPLSIMDIATAMTGKAPTSLDPDNDTVKVAMALVKIFQAAGYVHNENAIGDIQPMELDEDFKSNLKNISQDIDVSNLKDGSYASILKPWVDVSVISDQVALEVIAKTINMQNAGVFQSDFLPWPLPIKDGVDQQYIEGFHGKSLIGNELIGTLYLMTDRTGRTFGYGLQWKGKPNDKTSQGTALSDALKRLTLLSKIAPKKMNAEAQTNWINPLTKKIATSAPFTFTMADHSADDLKISQGKLLSGYIVAGTEAVYKQITSAKEGDNSAYSKWTQQFGPEALNGTIDISKTNPLAYLDKRIFSKEDNVKNGEYYIFPMYATLVFKFADTSIKDVKLGFVVDENGDIRSDIGPNSTSNDMSGSCATITDSNTLIDSNGVQQFRIGTTGTGNYGPYDKSLSIRMILTNSRFGLLEGAILGLNQSLLLRGGEIGETSQSLSSGGVKINLHNLITDHATTRGVNVTNFVDPSTSTESTVPQWINMQAAYQYVYNNIKDISPAPTAEQIALAKRVSGTLSIELPSCYTIKQK